MNFIFVSPHFPATYYRFCRALQKNGVTVLGIGDAPYANLSDDVKNSLKEYYYVASLEDYNAKKEAVSYFQKKYGKIDYIESNNEYWLQDDARLRTEFHITTGPDVKEIFFFRHKSAMKEYYAKAKCKTARWILVKEEKEAKKFIDEVGYPVIVKPDDGVGASKTHALKNDQELAEFFQTKDEKITFIMEEYIVGELVSYDGICDSKGNVVYPTSHAFPTQIMDVVNNNSDVYYYTLDKIPEDLDILGRRIVKTFKAKSRFFHLEFFRLTEDKKGLGKKGDYIGLEVNMRAPGGYTPDLIDFAHSIDIYQIWADVLTFDENREPILYSPTYCCYVGRRNYVSYKHYYEEIMTKYKNEIVFTQGMPDILSDAMGNYFFMAKFKEKKEMEEFICFLTERTE